MPALARVAYFNLWRSVRAPLAIPFRIEGLQLDVVRAVIVKAEQLVEDVAVAKVILIRPPTPPPPPQLLPPVVLAAVLEEKEPPSAREPESMTAVAAVVRVPVARRPRREEALVLQEVNGTRSLLLEVVRRSIYDWVLYRTSRRLNYRLLAEQSYQWLFVERPGSKDWLQREREGKSITSFVAICDALDLDIEEVRARARCLTSKSVMSIGRPAERRHADAFNTAHGDEGAYVLPAGMVPEEEVSDETVY